MTITQIRAVNFKGAKIDHALAPATAIIGPNMAGKSAIVQAIRLALAGWLPECGKTPRATWELSSGPDMLVAAFFDAGSITRQFWLEGQTVKSSVSAVGLEAAGALEDLPLLNAEAYFGMTDSERTAYVFERVTLPDSYTAKGIVAECERISFEEAHSEAIEEAKAATIEKVREYFGPIDVRVGDPSKSSCSPTVQDGLSVALEGFRGLFTYHNKRAKDTQGAVTTLAELKLRERNVTAAAVGNKEALVLLQEELDAINNEVGVLNAKDQGTKAKEARRGYLRTQIRVERHDYIFDIAKLREKKASFEAGYGKEMSLMAREKLRQKMKDENQLSVLMHELKGHEQTIKLAEEQLSEIEGMIECPYCHSKDADWKKHLQEGAELRIRKAQAAHADTTKTRDKMSAQVAELENKWAANEEIVKANGKLRMRIQEVEQQISANERQKASDEAALTAYRDELASITEETPVDYRLKLNEQTEKKAVLVKRRDQLQAAAQAEVELRQQLKLAAQAELEHQSAKAHVVVIKRIAELLKDKRESMVREVFETLLKVANEITGGILKSPIVLHENTVGRWDGAKFIPHRVFSGTEKALTYIAIAVALSAQAPLKLVILDEFGRLDEANQTLVLRRLTSCVRAKIIDQFIIVGTSVPMDQLEATKKLVPTEVIEL